MGWRGAAVKYLKFAYVCIRAVIMSAFFLMCATAGYLIYVSYEGLPAGVDEGPLTDSMVLGAADLALVKQSSIDGEEKNRNIQDRRVAVLDSDWLYCDPNKDVIIRVMDKYITDFASIPFPFTYLLSPAGKHSEAAILHDWLYAIGEPGKRAEADLYFYEAMRQSGVVWPIRRIMYGAVRKFGESGYGREDEWTERFYEKLIDRKLPKSCLPPKPSAAAITIEEIQRANYGSLYKEGDERQASFGASKVTNSCASSFFDVRPIDLANSLSSDFEWSRAMSSPECLHDLGVIATQQIAIEDDPESGEEQSYTMPIGVFFRSHKFASEKARCFDFNSILVQNLLLRNLYEQTGGAYSFRELGVFYDWESVTPDTQHFCTEKSLFDMNNPPFERYIGQKIYSDGLKQELKEHVRAVAAATDPGLAKELVRGRNLGVFTQLNATCEHARSAVVERLQAEYALHLANAGLTPEEIEAWRNIMDVSFREFSENAAALHQRLAEGLRNGSISEEDVRDEFGVNGVMAISSELFRNQFCRSIVDVNDYLLYAELERQALVYNISFKRIRELVPVLQACNGELEAASAAYLEEHPRSGPYLDVARRLRAGAEAAVDLPFEDVNAFRQGLDPDTRLLFDVAWDASNRCLGRRLAAPPPASAE